MFLQCCSSVSDSVGACPAAAAAACSKAAAGARSKAIQLGQHGLLAATVASDHDQQVLITAPVLEVISESTKDHSSSSSSAAAGIAQAAPPPGVPISHLRRISRAAPQAAAVGSSLHAASLQADRPHNNNNSGRMDAARFPTPAAPPYQQHQQKQNMVVVVQPQADGTHQQTADAGGQLTLQASGLGMQYQQQQQPQQQPQQQQQQYHQQQHHLQQGFPAQLVADSQQQHVQQQQQQYHQVQAGVLLQQTPQQPQQQQHPPQAYAQYAAPHIDQQQLTQQHVQQQGALPAYVAAGSTPTPGQRQGSANGTPMMRQSGGGAGVVRQEVALPVGGSVLAELDQLAAAVQVTPQQQQFQQGYVQPQAQQPRQSWEQPTDVLLQQQQRDLTPQRLQQQQQLAPGSQGMQMPHTPQQQVMVQQAQVAQQVVQMSGLQPQAQQHVVLQAVAVSGGNAAYNAPAAAPMQLPVHAGGDGQMWGGGASDVKQQPQLQPQAPAAHQQLQQQQPAMQHQQHQQQQADQQLLQLVQLQGQVQVLQQAPLAQLQVQPPVQQQQPQQQQHGMPPSPQCWGGPLAVIAQKVPSGGSGQPGSPLTYLAGTQQGLLQPDQQQAMQQQQQQQAVAAMQQQQAVAAMQQQHAAAIQQQQAQQQQQALDVLAALQQPNGATNWDAQALQQQQQQAVAPQQAVAQQQAAQQQAQQQAQLHPQHLQQLQLTPQQQHQDQFVDMVRMQAQAQQPQQQQQVVVVSAGMAAVPQQVAVMAAPAVVQLAPAAVAMQQQVVQQQQQQAGLMLPPAPRNPVADAQQQAQQQQQQGAVPPWRQGGADVQHPTPGITPAAIDREIPWAELQFGHQIGEGGFGKVYYGTWRGQAVAIKVLNPQSADSAKLMSEFNREVSTMTRLPEHPHVLKLLGVCTTPPNLALVTQFCAKGSLYGLLHSPGCYLSWVQVVAMLLDAARGMEHLHANSVLHRDLKSGNLLVDQDNMVRVADFGLSRLYHGMHTMTGGLGTFQWMAPEVLANQRYSNKADIYSFGMVMWECCARQVPFEGLNGVQAALAVMSRGMRPEIPQHTPAGLAALMQDCWAPVPEQRPGFDVVVARLQDLLTQLQHAEVTATAAAAANRAAAAITAAATGAARNASG